MLGTNPIAFGRPREDGPPYVFDFATSMAARGEIELHRRSPGIDADGLTVRDHNGTEHHIDATCKVWSAGVAASPLGTQLAAQSGADLDRAGRVAVNDDLTLQVAIQGGRYAATQIRAQVAAAAKTVRPPIAPRSATATRGRWLPSPASRRSPISAVST